MHLQEQCAEIDCMSTIIGPYNYENFTASVFWEKK